MALEQQIQKDIMEAMKAHDEARLNATRGIKSESLLAKTSGAEHELTDADVLKIIQKLVKQRKESAELYTQGNRPELAEKELSEMRVMEAYLPKALSEDEVKIIRAHMGSKLDEIESVMKQTAQALSTVTNYTAMVMPPMLASNRLRHIQLVPLREGRALVHARIGPARVLEESERDLHLDRSVRACRGVAPGATINRRPC